MRVLWTSLVEFPPLCKRLEKKIPPHCGWLYSSAKALLQNMPSLQLGVIIYSYEPSFKKYEVEGVTYYLIPCKSLSKTSQKQIKGCKNAIEDFKPDLIHIHGTEHSLAKAVCIANNNQIKTIANIQGLAGPYTRYADGGLSLWDKLTNITPLDFYRGTFLLTAKQNFKQRAQCENYVLTHISDIIGRTQWDYDHVISINPKLNYHFMNETLRDSFYNEPQWDIKNCKEHTIFVSNSGSALKGAHQVLKALPIILQQYPDTIVNFCGSSVMNKDLKSILRLQGYHLYLHKLVRKLKLENNVNFLGALTEKQMKQAFLDAHIYVMPSSIENSPNSLCEAQILGVPVIASYCGGVPTLVEEGKTGFLYRYEEYEMLAQLVIHLFKKQSLLNLSTEEKQVAQSRHNRINNSLRLSEIYFQIIKRKK